MLQHAIVLISNVLLKPVRLLIVVLPATVWPRPSTYRSRNAVRYRAAQRRTAGAPIVMHIVALLESVSMLTSVPLVNQPWGMPAYPPPRGSE